jgi:hypothetical protein
MVKKTYYFQLQNSGLNFIDVDSVDALKEKVKKEFGGDKAEVMKKIKDDLKAGQDKLADIEKKLKNATGKEFLELSCLAANYRLGIYKGEEELKRVQEMEKPDLVFFELTPVEW